MTKKIWYIQIEGKKEGPFTPAELKRDARVTPDTLVWKKGYNDWVPIRFVKELAEVFADEKKAGAPPEDLEEGLVAKVDASDQLTLAIREDPPHFFFWLLVVAILLSYLLYQLRWFT